MFRSILNRIMRRSSLADRFHARGLPLPMDSYGTPTSIWVAYTLDRKPAGYLITAGIEPIAFIFGAHLGKKKNPLTRADHEHAVAIAENIDLAMLQGPHAFDLREFDWNPHNPLAFILDLVLFPADRNGRAVKRSLAGPLHGATLTADGLRVALCEEAVPWGMPSASRRYQQIPTFAMNVNGSRAAAPVGLADYLDNANKKSGQSALATVPPGQLDGEKSRELTAA